MSLFPGWGSQGKATNLSQILIDVDAAQATLNQLQAKVEDIRKQKKQIEALSEQSGACWQGASNDAFRERLRQAAAEQESIANTMEANIKNLRKAIQTIVDEDAALARVIRNSGSSGSGRHG